MSRPNPQIVYIFALSAWDPTHVTPFQGFAPGLMELQPALHSLARLPPDIIELGLEPSTRLARRRSGSSEYMWSPVNIETLTRHHKPVARLPFMVIFTADRVVAQRVARWRSHLRIRPLHISTTGQAGAVSPDALTVELLQRHCRNSLRQAQDVDRQLDAIESKLLIDRWQPYVARPSSLRHHNHNVTVPNEMVLTSTGEACPTCETGVLNVSRHEDYVEGITESVLAVRNIQEQVNPEIAAFRVRPSRPDLIILAPAAMRGIERVLREVVETPAAKRALGLLERQRAYTMSFEIEDKLRSTNSHRSLLFAAQN